MKHLKNQDKRIRLKKVLQSDVEVKIPLYLCKSLKLPKWGILKIIPKTIISVDTDYEFNEYCDDIHLR